MKHFPSVTRILDATKPKHEIDAIEAWKARVGPEKAEAIRIAAIDRGRAYDKMVEDHIAGVKIAHHALWKTLSTYKIIEHEKDVYSTDWRYKGRLDCIYKQGPNIIINDFKGAVKVKTREQAHGYMLQLSAYWHAVEEMSAKAGDNMAIDFGLITWILPTSVSQMIVTRSQKDVYFEAFTKRVQQYYDLTGVTDAGEKAKDARSAGEEPGHRDGSDKGGRDLQADTLSLA